MNTVAVLNPHHDEYSKVAQAYRPRVILVEFIIVARVRPSAIEGHHRPVIASHFHLLDTNCPSKKLDGSKDPPTI